MTEEAVAACKALLDHFIRTFNAGDAEGCADTFHFPLIRLAAGRFRTWATREEFIADAAQRRTRFEAEGWHHSVMRDVKAVQASEDKVHLAIVNDRCHADGTVYKTFDTFWIATRLEGRWGIQFRSSFQEQ